MMTSRGLFSRTLKNLPVVHLEIDTTGDLAWIKGGRQARISRRACAVFGRDWKEVATLNGRYGCGLIWARGITITDNEVFGLYVHHGGLAHVEASSFLGTRSVPDADGNNIGGTNLTVRYGSTMEIRDIRVEHGDLAGVEVASAHISIANSTIRNNFIGLVCRDLPEDLDPDWTPPDMVRERKIVWAPVH